MTVQEQRQGRRPGRAVVLAVALAAGCGAAGRQAPPAQYGYGDMFVGDEERSYDEPGATQEYSGGEARGEVEAEPGPPARQALFGGFRGRRANREATAAPPPPPAPVVAQPSSGMPTPAPEPATSTPGAPTSGEGGQASAVPPEGEGREPAGAGERRAPMLIYEASLTLATRTVREQVDEAVRITRELGGIIVSQDDEGLVVRVPAPRFREALGLYEALGDVLARRVTAQDVSELVRDTRVRLQNARNLRDRLRELLQRATTVPESLAIERELERLNETIALLEGQLASLEERIAYSTVTLRFQPVQDTAEVPNALFRLPFDWLDEIGLPNLLSL